MVPRGAGLARRESAGSRCLPSAHPAEGKSMKRRLLAILGLFCGAALCVAADFEPPRRLKAGGEAVRVESPGYAFPCWADVDGDGKKDLVVGQFNKGKMRV